MLLHVVSRIETFKNRNFQESKLSRIEAPNSPHDVSDDDVTLLDFPAKEWLAKKGVMIATLGSFGGKHVRLAAFYIVWGMTGPHSRAMHVARLVDSCSLKSTP